MPRRTRPPRARRRRGPPRRALRGCGSARGATARPARTTGRTPPIRAVPSPSRSCRPPTAPRGAEAVRSRTFLAQTERLGGHLPPPDVFPDGFEDASDLALVLEDRLHLQ